MLAAGVDIKVVSETPGHSDTRITRITRITGDIYQPALDDLARDAAAAEKVVQLAPHARRPPPTVKDEEPTTPPPLRRTQSASPEDPVSGNPTGAPVWPSVGVAGMRARSTPVLAWP